MVFLIHLGVTFINHQASSSIPSDAIVPPLYLSVRICILCVCPAVPFSMPRTHTHTNRSHYLISCPYNYSHTVPSVPDDPEHILRGGLIKEDFPSVAVVFICPHAEGAR